MILNGHETQRYDGNLNISFACVEGESLIMAIKDMAVSSGSACTSSSLEPSYVLRAIGVTEDLAHTSLRIGFGRFTTEEEVDFAVDLIFVYVHDHFPFLLLLIKLPLLIQHKDVEQGYQTLILFPIPHHSFMQPIWL